MEEGCERAKQPYRIAMPDDAPFAFAGIWERWQNAHGELLESCAIVTTVASDALTTIHHRMPVILKPEDHDNWLAAPSSVLIAAYTGELRTYPISTAVNKVANDDNTLWDPVDSAPQAAQLDLLKRRRVFAFEEGTLSGERVDQIDDRCRDTVKTTQLGDGADDGIELDGLARIHVL